MVSLYYIYIIFMDFIFYMFIFSDSQMFHYTLANLCIYFKNSTANFFRTASQLLVTQYVFLLFSQLFVALYRVSEKKEPLLIEFLVGITLKIQLKEVLFFTDTL